MTFCFWRPVDEETGERQICGLQKCLRESFTNEPIYLQVVMSLHERLQRKAHSSDGLCVARGLAVESATREPGHVRWQGHARKKLQIPTPKAAKGQKPKANSPEFLSLPAC